MKRLIITDFDKQLTDELKTRGYDVCTFSKAKGFKGFLGHHTDIFFLLIDNTLFVSDAVEIDDVDNRNIVKISGIKEGYPLEAGLNCLYMGRKIFCNTKTVLPEVKDYAEKNGICTVHTNQGYTKCSAAIAGENAVITEDKGLYDVLKNEGVDVLLIEKGHVELQGYNYGFIGGASFFDNNTKILYFFGDIDKTPYAEKVYDFCKKQGVKVISLMKDKHLTDYGSAILM